MKIFLSLLFIFVSHVCLAQDSMVFTQENANMFSNTYVFYPTYQGSTSGRFVRRTFTCTEFRVGSGTYIETGSRYMLVYDDPDTTKAITYYSDESDTSNITIRILNEKNNLDAWSYLRILCDKKGIDTAFFSETGEVILDKNKYSGCTAVSMAGQFNLDFEAYNLIEVRNDLIFFQPFEHKTELLYKNHKGFKTQGGATDGKKRQFVRVSSL